MAGLSKARLRRRRLLSFLSVAAFMLWVVTTLLVVSSRPAPAMSVEEASNANAQALEPRRYRHYRHRRHRESRDDPGDEKRLQKLQAEIDKLTRAQRDCVADAVTATPASIEEPTSIDQAQIIADAVIARLTFERVTSYLQDARAEASTEIAQAVEEPSMFDIRSLGVAIICFGVGALSLLLIQWAIEKLARKEISPG